MNSGLEMAKELAEAFRRRELERGGYGKGKKRDDALFEFYVGAANAVGLIKGTTSEEYNGLVSWITFVLAFKGYRALVQEGWVSE